MNKEQIIADFNYREKKLKEEYSKTDGARYLRTIQPDPMMILIFLARTLFSITHNVFGLCEGRDSRHKSSNLAQMIIVVQMFSELPIA